MTNITEGAADGSVLPVPAMSPVDEEAALQENARILSLCTDGNYDEARNAMAVTQAALPVNHVKDDILPKTFF